MSKVDKARELILSTGGKVFTVVFTKANGERRVMNAEIGVKKGDKTGDLPTSNHIPNLMVVYDMKKGGKRHVNLNTIEEIRCFGKVFVYKEGEFREK